ncbi:basic amino acid/polyamine antiporter [Nocardioides lianchengensis]|uniref:Arginine:ornithine antiporter / lysine permease n=1 Tax=Nocardioides lianchengensis TaxID=1045774 RepID=A0A1G7C3V5_9ACTN|nr:basic amino acid/polyamine antiporter [Nocardioides lianchengensis]NYG09270.1 arginine:ornithine antiporter/lysine permease [Nocardioides lianchengensis]SDE33346.1 arginine:ornithine antiporter / lysine permease [Nocardioides lianchengensis]
MTSDVSADARAGSSAAPKVGVLTLAAMVVGSMIGGGIFTLPSNFGGATGVLGALIAWTVAGLGMLMLAFVFQSLAMRRPDLDNGIYVYAQAGFGPYAGFNAAWGYWASNVVGNVFFMVFAMASIGEFVPGLGDGSTLFAVLLASVGVWTFHVLISRGIRQAAVVNRIVTIAKLLPIVVFIVLALVSFDAGTFGDNFWGGRSHTLGSLFDQVTDTMLVTTFVFLGIEGASVYSRLAQRREDVGRATLLGFVSTLALFASVTLVSYGVLPQRELAAADQPSMGAVLESVVGSWGATFISIGVIISVLGAYLAWTLLNAEVLFMPARTDVMPRFLGRENASGTPIAALITTTVSVQLFLLLVLVVEDALDFMLDLDTALTLVPYLLAAAYAVKLALTREGFGPEEEKVRRKELAVALLACLYSVFLLYAAGPKYLLLGCIIYAPGAILYVVARREQRQRIFTPPEAVGCVILSLLAMLGIVLIGNGTFSL